MNRLLLFLLIAVISLLTLSGCATSGAAGQAIPQTGSERIVAGIDRIPNTTIPGGDVEQGRMLLESWGCGSCHHIPGVRGADAFVGPPLGAWVRRQYIAGSLPNTPENLIEWIVDPQAIEPGTAMPDLDVPEDAARHMGAYLYSLEELDR